MNTDRDVSAALNDFIAVNTAYAEPPSESSDPFNSLIPLNLIDRTPRRSGSRSHAEIHECNQEGAKAPLGSELRRTYDTMVEARKARDEEHSPGTWMG